MRKNPLLLFGAIFSAVGLPLLIIAGFLIFRDIAFFNKAVEARGTVIELEEKVSRDRDGTSRSYYPRVSFIDNKGKEFTFTSNSGSNPPGFSEGEEVTVLYDPASPSKAKIDTFFQTWGMSFFVAILGVIFSALGLSFLIYAIKKIRMKKWLKSNGQAISAEVKSIGLNTSVKINGQSPWQIIAQWQDASSDTVYIFKSEHIWFDPTDFIKDQTVKVLIDPKNPKHYYMDISFLPKEGN